MQRDTHPVHPLHPENSVLAKSRNGITIREYLAGLAMQGLLASFTEKAARGLWTTEIEEIASTSVQMADALLLALNQESSGQSK